MKCFNVNCDSYSPRPDNNCLSRGDVSACPDVLNRVDDVERGYSSCAKHKFIEVTTDNLRYVKVVGFSGIYDEKGEPLKQSLKNINFIEEAIKNAAFPPCKNNNKESETAKVIKEACMKLLSYVVNVKETDENN